MLEIAAGPEPAAGSADSLVVGARPDRDFGEIGEWLDEAVPWLDSHLEQSEFEGKVGSVSVVPSGGGIPYERLVVVGLGSSPDAEAVRRAAGSAGRVCTSSQSVATTLHAAAGDGSAEAVAIGFALGQYTFDRHKSEPKPSKTTSLVLCGASDGEVVEAQRGQIVADGVTMARDLVNEPAMDKSPAALAEMAAAMAGDVGLRVRILDEGQIAAEQLGGLQGVALGASNPPRLVELWHEPDDARAFLAIVGKGIVFDSGGLSIKSAKAMETMKTDMSGAATVFGAMKVIARLGVPIRVVGMAPLTENMPGGGALRPGDVVQARNGKTIEVLNTDAEGRVVLADALSLAVEAEPDLIVDVATLTGACKVALGDKIAGLLGTDDAVAQVEGAAASAGERVWRLPLPDDYRQNIDSDVADMKNSGPRWGGAINAALLLREFVDDRSWAHLDIAGPARASDAEHYIAKGGTGFGVRTIVALAQQMAEREAAGTQ